MKRYYLLIFCLGLAASGVTGCNTAEGLGRDLEMAGRGLATTAEKAKEEGPPKPPPPPAPPRPSR